MLLDVLTLNQKLTALEAAMQELRDELSSLGPRLDGLESLASVATGRGRQISLAPGYTALSPEVGVYIPNGAVDLEVSERSGRSVLKIHATDERTVPEHLVIQLNLGPKFLRARDGVTVTASWIGELIKPQIDCRLVAGDEIIRRDVATVDTVTSGLTMQALARFRFPPSTQRSDGIDQARLCLLFDNTVLGGEITSLLAA